MNLKDMVKQAELEIKREQDRVAIEKLKDELRNKKTLWQRIFPFKIRIERR